MSLSVMLYIVLFTSLMLLVAQLFIPNKKLPHILFAIFCGSIAILMTKKLSGNSIGAYQYLIGMGACATCNCYWLLSRSIFRSKNSISIEHVLFAGAIAILQMLQQGYLFVTTNNLISTNVNSVSQHLLGEFTILLSSCVLVLSFWEGCRGFNNVNKKDKAQRILFLATFGSAVVISKTFAGLSADFPQAQEWVIASLTLFVLINTQILIFWRFKTQQVESKNICSISTEEQLNMAVENVDISSSELELATQVKNTIVESSLFLQPNLKLADIARKLDEPEYRISKALRHHLKAKNFNQYINELRIEYSKTLLTDLEKQKWPVIVVGMESGFASVGPFTRAFKAMTGCTPNQFRQQELLIENNLIKATLKSAIEHSDISYSSRIS